MRRAWPAQRSEETDREGARLFRHSKQRRQCPLQRKQSCVHCSGNRRRPECSRGNRAVIYFRADEGIRQLLNGCHHPAKCFELDSCNKIKDFTYAPDAAKCRISGNPDSKCSAGWWVLLVL